MTTATIETEKIVEQFAGGVLLGEATVAGSMIRNVCLCGSDSKNGRTYLPTAFGDGQLYENRPVMIDHNLGDPTARSVKDLAGTIIKARVVDGKPYGDIQVIETDAGETLLKVAKAAARDVGMSHSARGTFTDSTRKIVEAIEEVFSVDVVMFPATTRNFSEQTLPDIQSITDVDELREMLAEAINERDAALARLGDESLTIDVYRECREAGLDTNDPAQVSPEFVDALITLTPTVRESLIAGHVTALRSVGRLGGGQGTLFTRERTYGLTPKTDPTTAENVERLFGNSAAVQNANRLFGPRPDNAGA